MIPPLANPEPEIDLCRKKPNEQPPLYVRGRQTTATKTTHLPTSCHHENETLETLHSSGIEPFGAEVQKIVAATARLKRAEIIRDAVVSITHPGIRYEIQ